MGWDDEFAALENGAVGIFLYGWGDKLVKGFIPKYLAKIGIDDCYDYIKNNRDLLAPLQDKHWALLRKVARAGKINLTTEEILTTLQKNRLDVLSVIINYPDNGGVEWLERQVANCRAKLGC